MSTDTTFCWRCGAEYPASSLQCPACCASNELIDIESVNAEMADAGLVDHDWHFHDDSFDHEHGVEVIRYWECQRCGQTGERNVGIRPARREIHACQ